MFDGMFESKGNALVFSFVNYRFVLELKWKKSVPVFLTAVT